MNFFKDVYACLALAFAFLTRIPVPGIRSISFSQNSMSRSLITYPLVGLFFGLVSFGLIFVADIFHSDVSLIAFVILAVPFVLNRFLHFDGLCDVMDAFLADKTPEQRLEILKDSTNGSFALGAAILFMLGKFLLIVSLLSHKLAVLLLFAPLVSRWIMVPMAFKAVYPRKTGTGFAVIGQVSAKVLIAATLMLAASAAGVIYLCMVVEGRAFFLPLSYLNLISAFVVGVGVSVAWMFLLRALSGKKIGGVTGDVLGCLAETTELVFCVAACAPLMIMHNWY